MSNLHKNTDKSFSKTIKALYHYIDPKTGQKAGLIADEIYQIIQKNADRLDSAILYDRDYDFDFFGFRTLERSYLLRMNGEVVERPASAGKIAGTRGQCTNECRADCDIVAHRL